MEEAYYYQFNFECLKIDELTALLNELPFNGFEDIDTNTLNAYADNKSVDDDFLDQLENIRNTISFSYTHKKIKLENWNANWEKDFEPVIVDEFCVIRADFHESFGNKEHEIVITPQMSFGTGHHETTRGMIQMMRDMDFVGKKVLDFGCGTCVLAILSAKLGASDILGVDIDNNAYMNSIHNCAQNGVDHIRVMKGGLSVTDDNYDVILANINRHVILDTLPSLSSKLNTGKPLLISGVLYSDIPLVEKHLKKASFKVVKALQLNDWMCILTEKV
jgi:Ribosomal protein L11 methylase